MKSVYGELQSLGYSREQFPICDSDFSLAAKLLKFGLEDKQGPQHLFDKIEFIGLDRGACIGFEPVKQYFQETVKQQPRLAIDELARFNDSIRPFGLGWRALAGDALLNRWRSREQQSARPSATAGQKSTLPAPQGTDTLVDAMARFSTAAYASAAANNAYQPSPTEFNLSASL